MKQCLIVEILQRVKRGKIEKKHLISGQKVITPNVCHYCFFNRKLFSVVQHIAKFTCIMSAKNSQQNMFEVIKNQVELPKKKHHNLDFHLFSFKTT